MFEILNQTEPEQAKFNRVDHMCPSHPAPTERAQNTLVGRIEEHLGGSRDGITTTNDYVRIRAGVTGGGDSRLR
jgi:hypothetical protein